MNCVLSDIAPVDMLHNYMQYTDDILHVRVQRSALSVSSFNLLMSVYIHPKVHLHFVISADFVEKPNYTVGNKNI